MKNQVASASPLPHNFSKSNVDEGYNDASDGSQWQKGKTIVSYISEAWACMDV
jgi:hypothetical protein